MSELKGVAGAGESDIERRLRLVELANQAREETTEEPGNKNFVQVYPKGWARLQHLIKTNPSAARVYAFIAEHIDGVCGVVVVSQDVLAIEIGVHVATIKRQTKLLEDEGALVRIKVGTGVYAYALDPEEVWRSWNTAKETAAFTTRTLVRRADRMNGQVRRKLKVMMDGRTIGSG